MSFGTLDQSFVTPGMGGFGGFGGGCGGPMWLLLGLLFSRCGFGGFGGGAGAIASGEFNAIADTINGSRAETISAVTAARSESLSALQSLASTMQQGRVEEAANLGALLQAIASGNTNVKEQLFSLIGSTSAENRALFGDISGKLCAAQLLACQNASNASAELSASTNLLSTTLMQNFNCVEKNIAALQCGQASILEKLSEIVPAIMTNLNLMKAQEKADMLAARVAQLEMEASKTATDVKLNAIINLLGSVSPLKGA